MYFVTGLGNPRGRPLGRKPGKSEWKDLVDARLKLKMNQNQTASVLGVSQSVLSEWETLQSAPLPRYWEVIAAFIGVPVAEVGKQIADNFVTVSP